MIISDVADKDKAAVEEVLRKFKIIEHTEGASLIRKNAIACGVHLISIHAGWKIKLK